MIEIRKSGNVKSIGQTFIEMEDKSEETRSFSVNYLKIVRSILIIAPPILTDNLELGNYSKGGENDFIFKDFDEYVGNLID